MSRLVERHGFMLFGLVALGLAAVCLRASAQQLFLQAIRAISR